MKPRLIVIDGKTYTSVNEMPADVRLQYEQAMSSFKDQDQNRIPDSIESGNLPGDNNRNGLPDVFENAFSSGNLMSSMKVIMDGKEVNSPNDLPPDARARYDRAMSGLDVNKNGLPDFMEGMMGTQQQASSVSTSFEAPRPPRSQPINASPTVTPDTSNGWMLALLAMIFLMVCAVGAVGIWYFFFR